ncbi:MAG: hypothetical protein ACYC91_10815 [Solirubrobacteraceae bacterium]
MRYAVERPLIGLRALELGNEPDYMWTPEEVKIEWGGLDLINPLGKYITELQLGQVPQSDRGLPAFERSPWGFQAQDGAWSAERAASQTPVLEFDWGPKFDWYVRCYADYQRHVAWAVKDEATKHGVEVATVSASVTHNNIDYLLRMHRAVPGAFEYIDKIGLHPYHWVNNDVWDREFLRDEGIEGWPAASPREFAGEKFKRFDFVSAFRKGSGEQAIDQEIAAAFADKPLWLTEFGIGSKAHGTANAPVAQHTRFIRPRALVGGSGGHGDVVWEDLWESFLDQVDAGWLRGHGIECMLIYGLRELGFAGFDLDDDDRSNLALLHRDGAPRLDERTLGRVSGLLGELAGAAPRSRSDRVSHADPVLYRRLWTGVELPARALEVLTMLSVEERQLLYWLARSRFSGAGAIVDGGCFVGGSTVALGEGLRASGRDAVIDVFDMFEVEPYMTDFYFRGEDLKAGDSFRPVFGRNTDHVADLLRVHEGDLMASGWRGDPIEILFVDISKTWGLNDFLVSEFFPCLIPQRSVVVQQDFVYPGCPWVIVTMEYLADCFTPVAFAEYCSVVYQCTAPVPRGLEPVSALAHEVKMDLVQRAVGRFMGYPRAVLECAKATLLWEQGDFEAARAVLAGVQALPGSDHFAVSAAVGLVNSLLPVAP